MPHDVNALSMPHDINALPLPHDFNALSMPHCIYVCIQLVHTKALVPAALDRNLPLNCYALSLLYCITCHTPPTGHASAAFPPCLTSISSTKHHESLPQLKSAMASYNGGVAFIDSRTEFTYPAQWLADQTVAYRAAQRA
eukprot:scaffold111522_cov21-Tisochrysis_lutea.AAC.2